MQPGGRAKNGARKRATGSQMKIELGRPVTRFVRSGTRLHVCKNAGNVLPGPRWNPPGTRLHVCLIPPHLGPGHTFFGRRKNGGNVLPGPRWKTCYRVPPWKTAGRATPNVLPGPTWVHPVTRFGFGSETKRVTGSHPGHPVTRFEERPPPHLPKRCTGSHLEVGHRKTIRGRQGETAQATSIWDPVTRFPFLANVLPGPR